MEETNRDGDAVAAEGFTHLIPHAAGHEIIRQGKKDLTLARALLVAAVTGLLLILLQWPIAAMAFSMVGASEAVTARWSRRSTRSR